MIDPVSKAHKDVGPGALRVANLARRTPSARSLKSAVRSSLRTVSIQLILKGPGLTDYDCSKDGRWDFVDCETHWQCARRKRQRRGGVGYSFAVRSARGAGMRP